MNQRPKSEAWKLKHQLIAQSIIKNHDFDLEQINRTVQQHFEKESKDEYRKQCLER